MPLSIDKSVEKLDVGYAYNGILFNLRKMDSCAT